ncbi:MAG TPA: hypothetical protein VFU49_07615 [Ktedonobacteraceae bacterium]|nr:hypothetical protein [Ktedonobacteraceae bacterium]
MAREREEDILRITARYVAEVQAGLQPRLSEYLARYPQYASAIVDFVAYYHAVEAHMPINTDGDAALSQISQQALERVQAQESSQAAEQVNIWLLPNGRSFVLSELAAELNLSLDMVILLRQGMIESATIPYELFRRLAIALGQPVSVVQGYFQEDQPGGQGTGMRAKPRLRIAEQQNHYPGNVQKQSFRQALQASLLISAEQSAIWEEILAREML